MTTKLIRFSLYKSPGPEGLRLRDTQSIQSTRALAGMETVFQNLSQINAEVYRKVRTLDEFTVSLTPLPGSENYGLQIRSKKLQINIGKLKPETRALFFASIEPQPLAKNVSGSNPALSLGPDTMSSMDAPSSFLKDLLVPWTMIVSTFREWMNSFLKLFSNAPASKSDILEKSSEKKVSFEQKVNLSLPVEPVSTDVFYDLESARESRGILDITDPKKEARIQRRLAKAKKTAKQAPLPQPVARPPNQATGPAAALTKSNLPPEEGYSKLIPLRDEKSPVKRVRSILLESSPSKAIHSVKENDDFEMISSESKIKASPMEDPARLLKRQFEGLFSMRVEPDHTKEKDISFGAYFLERILQISTAKSCTLKKLDEEVLEFTINFPESRVIPLTQIPKKYVEAKLLNSIAADLVIGKEVKCTIHEKTLAFEFDNESIKICVSKKAPFGMRLGPYTVSLKSLRPLVNTIEFELTFGSIVSNIIVPLVKAIIGKDLSKPQRLDPQKLSEITEINIPTPKAHTDPLS